MLPSVNKFNTFLNKKNGELFGSLTMFLYL